VGNAGGSAANGGAPGTGGAQATGASNGGGGVVGSGGVFGTGGTSASKCPAGWNLAWSDEFDGPAGTAANGNNWVYETGNNNGWGNNELEYYQAGNANGALDGKGNFVITSKKETAGGFNYTSARLKTQGKHDWTYGHFEARIKIPYGQGMWPAFWMMGSTGGNWPACGEIDIMESLGKEPNIELHHAWPGQARRRLSRVRRRVGNQCDPLVLRWSAVFDQDPDGHRGRQHVGVQSSLLFLD
jgi:hypothetical protein